MKRVVSIFLAFICLTLNVWTELHYHYCGDTLRSVSWSSERKPCACPTKKRQDRSCCNTQTQTIALHLSIAPSVAGEQAIRQSTYEPLHWHRVSVLFTSVAADHNLSFPSHDAWYTSIDTRPIYLTNCVWIV